MPKKSNNQDWSILSSLGDLSVEDVTNRKQKRQCIKKLASNANKVYQSGQSQDQLSWDEQMSEDDDRDQDMVNTSFPPVTGTKRKRRRKADCIISNTGNFELPLDIWELISAHIYPEDVGRFAAICRTTAFIISTARFWYSLYRRYCYPSQLCLPKELCWPELRQSGVKGLRNRVVRALYFTYKPLAQTRVLRSISVSGTAVTDTLLTARCVLYWHRRYHSDSHLYVFKFHHRERLPNQALFVRWSSGLQHKDRMCQQQPLCCQDPEDACYLLVVSCSSVCQVDSTVVGRYLNLVCESPAEITNCRMNKLVLTLSGAPYASSVRLSELHTKNNTYRPIGWNETTKVVLQPVVSVQVVPWWHQQYYELGWAGSDVQNENDPFDKPGPIMSR